MIDLVVHGWSWYLLTWLAVASVGASAGTSNISDAWRQLRGVQTGESEKRARRRSTVVHLALNVLVGACLVVALSLGIVLQFDAFVGGLMLTFTSRTKELAFPGGLVPHPGGSHHHRHRVLVLRLPASHSTRCTRA